MRRVAIFVFYDEDGIADGYIDCYLRDLTKHVDRLLVVSNCRMTKSAIELFEKYTDEIYTRENVGFDAWAYKTGLEKIGWERLSEYDEAILANDTVFGPVYPFSEMFDVMSGRGLDFWGITKHWKYEYKDFTAVNPYYSFPAHIQSYFTVCGKRLLASEDFKRYWESLPAITTFEEAVSKHEMRFTEYLSKKGFSWDVYADMGESGGAYVNPLYSRPQLLLEKRRLPVVKCKLFCTDSLSETAGEQASETFSFIRENTDYDTDLIWSKILRRFHQYDIAKSMALTYVLPVAAKSSVESSPSRRAKTALIMHLYYPSMFDEAFHYAQSMPSDADIFLSTDTLEKSNALKALFANSGYKTDVRVVSNRGRSESALLVGMRDVTETHDLICFWKEKKSSHIDPQNAAVSWSKKISENLLPSGTYVENVISLFDDNPRLGLLSPTPPNHSVLFAIPGREWEVDYDRTRALASRLDLRAPMSKDKPPVCPLGGAFWFRAAALRKLFDSGWTYEDFPVEPLPLEGTLLHAIERIYPYVAQDAGYYSAYALSDVFASIELTNLTHYLRSFNEVAMRAKIKHGYYGFSFSSVDTGASFSSVTRWYLRKMIPETIFLSFKAARILIFGPGREQCAADIKRYLRKRKAKRAMKRLEKRT
jgi:rhamnosyltransferase